MKEPKYCKDCKKLIRSSNKSEYCSNCQLRKNKKIHRLLIKEGKPYYLCNQAVTPSKNKCSILWNKVTCKNCLDLKN